MHHPIQHRSGSWHGRLGAFSTSHFGNEMGPGSEAGLILDIFLFIEVYNWGGIWSVSGLGRISSVEIEELARIMSWDRRDGVQDFMHSILP